MRTGEGPEFRSTLLGLALAALLAGCAAPPGGATADGGGAKASTPKHITAAILGSPHALSVSVDGATGTIAVGGLTELENLANVGLSRQDSAGVRRPLLAEAVPSTENGLWQVLPDGRMETTWKLRPDARWHDQGPVTSDDILFTALVARDRDSAAFKNIAYSSVDEVTAPDPLTVTVKWSKPFIQADTMFGILLPKHLLEKDFAQDKSELLQLPYWNQDFVGTGPFKLKEWENGSHATLDAFSEYPLGKPSIDQIEVRFITDASTLVANVLAGTVDLTVGRGLALEQALTAQQQWPDGSVGFKVTGWIMLYPQFIDSEPKAVADVRFRRSLLEAIDRQEMADSLQAGVTPVAHTFLTPETPEYRTTEASIVRYEYDPRKALDGLDGLGYRKGIDGKLQDSSGRPLAIEIRQSGIQISQRAMFAVADYWQRLGASVEPVAVPPQRSQEREYMTTFPAFLCFNQPIDIDSIRRQHSANTALPDNRYQATGNWSRYQDPEFDGLIDRLYTTIPLAERMQVLGQIVHHVSDQLNQMGLFYNADPTLMSGRLTGVAVSPSTITWNAEQWDVRS